MSCVMCQVSVEGLVSTGLTPSSLQDLSSAELVQGKPFDISDQNYLLYLY